MSFVKSCGHAVTLPVRPGLRPAACLPANVARAVEILLTAEGVAGQVYNCYDLYVSRYDVAATTKRLAGSQSEIHGTPGSPKHQIVTEKLRRLGMEFGGRPLLEQTIRQMLDTRWAK